MLAPDFTFTAIGTSWHISLEEELALTKKNAILKAVQDRIGVFDETYSRFRQDSLISKIASQAGEYILPADAKLLFDLYFKLYKLTNGLMTPLVGQVLVDAGYDAQYSLIPKPLSQPPAWEEVLIYDCPKLTVKQPV